MQVSNYHTISKSQNKIAKKSDLEKISFLITDRKVPGLTGKCRDTLMFLVALAKMGFSEVIAHVAVICSAIDNSSGCSISDRSLRRSLAHLESLGFLTRQKFCYGTNRYQTHIILHIDRFRWWMNNKKSHLPQTAHTRPKWPDYTITSNNSTLCNSKNSFIYSNSKPVEKSTNKTKKPFSKWMHPVLFSVIQSAKRLKMPADMLKYLISACENEIAGEKIGLSSPSGIEWNRSQWQKMSIAERESVARLDILPRFIPQFFEKTKNEPTLEPIIEKKCTVTVEESEKIRALIRKSLGKTEINQTLGAVCPNHVFQAVRPVAVALTPNELSILEQAKQKIAYQKSG